MLQSDDKKKHKWPPGCVTLLQGFIPKRSASEWQLSIEVLKFTEFIPEVHRFDGNDLQKSTVLPDSRTQGSNHIHVDSHYRPLKYLFHWTVKLLWPNACIIKLNVHQQYVVSKGRPLQTSSQETYWQALEQYWIRIQKNSISLLQQQQQKPVALLTECSRCIWHRELPEEAFVNKHIVE